MGSLSRHIAELPVQQRAIWDKCFHPTGTFVDFEKAEVERSIPERFQEQVRKYPHRLAVKTDSHRLSYDALNRAANRIARAVLGLQGSDEGPVALMFEKGAPLISAIIGVLKAGKTYVPLDPSYPYARTAYILEDSHAGLIVSNHSNHSLAEELAQGSLPMFNIDDLDDGASSENLGLSIDPNTPAWIIYTSGSTGQPKGVVQTHRNVLHFVMNYTNYFHISVEDRLTLLFNCSVNGGAHDIFTALLTGAALFPFDVKGEGLSRLADWLVQEEITIYHSVPTLFRHFVEILTKGNDFPAIRLVRLIGEPVYKRDVDMYREHFSENCIFVNRLGSTETGSILLNLIDKETEIIGNNVPLGYAVEGNQILLLDDAGKEPGVNEVGEIAVKSEYLSPGYWEKPDLTNAAYFPDPEGGKERTYLMGDMGYKLVDGCVVCLGRKDFQVKVRGFRIEVAEVEMALVELDTIKQAVVHARQELNGDQRLVAYLITGSDPAPSATEIRNWLEDRLPDYMVPSYYVFLDALPLLPNGKVDRRSLPEIGHGRPELETPFVKPRTPMEEVLAGIWEEVLGIDRVGIHDDFLELGGDSLLAMSMFLEIEKTLGKKLSLSIMVDASTIEQMAYILRDEKWSAPQSSLVAIQTGGTNPPFFCVHGAGGHVLGFKALARHLGNEQPFYGLEAPGRDGEQRPLTQVEALAARYIDEIRGLQPEGPYFLGGLSMGGVVAFEMAQQLRVRNQEVALVALLDTVCPVTMNAQDRGMHRVRRLAYLTQRVFHHTRNLLGLTPREQASYIKKKARLVKGMVIPDVRKINERLGRSYEPKGYPGRITLFWARERPVESPDPRWGWKELAGGGLEVREVPGDHLSMMREPHIQVLAQELEACLDAAQKVGTASSP